MTTIIHPPALPKAPSERDQRIFLAVHGLGKLQAEAAEEFGVSQGRVSQICKRVQRWRARLKPQISEEQEQARLDLYLKRETLREMKAEALRDHRRSQRPLKTVRKRVRYVEEENRSQESGVRSQETAEGRKKRRRVVEFIETTIREQPVSMQGFNTALKIMEMEDELAERKPAAAPEEQDDPLWYMLWEMVISARTHAEKDNRVNPCGDKHALAEHVLGIVYGKDVQVAPRPPSVVKKRPEGAKPTRYEPDYEGEETRNRGQGTGVAGAERSSAPVGGGAGRENADCRLQSADWGTADISQTHPGANKVNTKPCAPEAEITPEEVIRHLEEACAAGTYLSDDDRAVLQKQIEVERQKLANISAGGEETGDREQGTGDGSLNGSSSTSSSSSVLGASLLTRPSGRPKVSGSAGRPEVGSSAGSGDPRPAEEPRTAEDPRTARPEPRRRRFEPTPPEDYGWRPSVPSKEWLEGERERTRECLKALVPVVTESGEG